MKKFIHKTNQYLLENYPLVWNTRIVWMLSTALLLHIAFFLFGLIALINPEHLQRRSALSIFFENGTIYFSTLISILLIVIWLIYLFKNNAFKNFYPTHHYALFKQFTFFFIILISSTTFYYSYTLGLKTYIVTKYDDHTIANEILLANKTAPFLSEKIQDYTIDQLIHPKPFNTLFCETQNKLIDFDSIHYGYLDSYYQFYSLKQKTRLNTDTSKNKDSLYANYSYYTDTDTSTIYYYKDKIIDITAQLKSTKPSYYNYSKVFYSNTDSDKSYNYYQKHNYNNRHKTDLELAKIIQKENQELLDRNSPLELKKLFSEYIVIANKYKIKHNLSPKDWLDLIYTSKTYKLKAIIKDSAPNDYYYKGYDKQNLSLVEEQQEKMLTDYYFKSDDLRNVFENIDDIKNSEIFTKSIHIFIWLSFFIALVIFMFRVTGLKPLLFTIVSIGLLAIIIGLLITMYTYVRSYGNNDMEFFASYLVLFIGTFILFTSFFLMHKLKKIIAAIFLNIALVGFIPYLLLIIVIISMHQTKYYNSLNIFHDKDDYFTLIEWQGLNWSYVLLICGFIFIFLFSKIILKWKAVSEG